MGHIIPTKLAFRRTREKGIKQGKMQRLLCRKRGHTEGTE